MEVLNLSSRQIDYISRFIFFLSLCCLVVKAPLIGRTYPHQFLYMLCTTNTCAQRPNLILSFALVICNLLNQEYIFVLRCLQYANFHRRGSAYAFVNNVIRFYWTKHSPILQLVLLSFSSLVMICTIVHIVEFHLDPSLAMWGVIAFEEVVFSSVFSFRDFQQSAV